ncbi:MAG: hypothetical protein JEZ11_07445 [Desulfobacterales bacterium]|nr:hypothetical protein [Desulfobacterales bacterium]
MQCIDAIEGSVKTIIQRLHRLSAEYLLDDTEYIRNVKATIEAVGDFLQVNQEIVTEPAMLKKVLYDYARNLWMAGQKETGTAPETPATNGEDLEAPDYQEYYFGYIYKHGMYPR